MKARATTDKTTELHPWVRMTQASLEKAKPGMYDVLLAPGIGRLNVEVSRETIPRSMLVWDRLLKSVETSGFMVRMTKEHPFRTIVTVDEEPLSLRVREVVSRSEHVPTAAEKERMKRLGLTHVGPTWDYRPSGRLVLTIDHVNCHNHARTELTWSDTKKQPLEDRVHSIADVLAKIVRNMKIRWKLAKERQAIWREEERQRTEVIRLQAEEKSRCEQLERQSSSWSLTCLIRGFIQAVREEAIRQSGAIESGSTADQWLQWAERHAASIDPVASVITNLTPTRAILGEQHHEDRSGSTGDHIGR